MLSVIQTDAKDLGGPGNRRAETGFSWNFVEGALVDFQPIPQSLQALVLKKCFIPIFSKGRTIQAFACNIFYAWKFFACCSKSD
jgi:hypothetical protein